MSNKWYSDRQSRDCHWLLRWLSSLSTIMMIIYWFSLQNYVRCRVDEHFDDGDWLLCRTEILWWSIGSLCRTTKAADWPPQIFLSTSPPKNSLSNYKINRYSMKQLSNKQWIDNQAMRPAWNEYSYVIFLWEEIKFKLESLQVVNPNRNRFPMT